jgi:hypothetical protein
MKDRFLKQAAYKIAPNSRCSHCKSKPFIYLFVLIKLGRRRDRGLRLPRLIYQLLNLALGWMIIIVK